MHDAPTDPLPAQVGFAILTVSDTRDMSTDKSGGYLAAQVEGEGHTLAARAIVPDDTKAIRAQVEAWIADPAVHAIVSTGGTGLTGRDITPEAVKPYFKKEIEGFNTVWHMVSFKSVGVSTLQSRACAGLTENGTYIFALPGSSGAVRDGWEHILKPEFDRTHRPCNLVEIIPRLTEA